MSRFKNDDRGWSRVGASLAIAGMAAVACGDGFNTANCEESRTCAMVPDGPGGQDGVGGDDDVGATSGSAGTTGAGGSGGSLGNGGSANPPGGSENVGGCGSECAPLEAAPRVVAVSPEAGTDSAEPDAAITIEFSEALDPETVTSDSVRVLDGETPVAGKLSYDGKVATFVPDVRLALLASYEVQVSDAVTDEAGTPLEAPYNATFTVRDGAWHVIDAATAALSYLAPTAPIDAQGNVLVVWSGSGTESCPTAAARYELGAITATPQPFTQTAAYCWGLWAAANADGVGAAAWVGGGPSFLQQYRAGKWLTSPLQVTTDSSTSVSAIAVSPLGITTRFESLQDGGLVARRTNTAGVWQAAADTLAPATLVAMNPADVAFDGEGNGVVAFRARDISTQRQRIMASRYTVATGKWATAQELPGSLANASPSGMVRGTPVVEVAPSGEAVVLWHKGDGDGALMSNRFVPQTGWSEAQLVSGTGKVIQPFFTPGATYDGSHFVAAWQADPGDGVRQMFTSSYEPVGGWSKAQLHDAKRKLKVDDHPQLVSDGRGNVLMVWITGEAPAYTLVQQRFVAGAWSAIEALPGGSLVGDSPSKPSIAMNRSGVAALTWGNEEDGNHVTTIRLARFY